jgi:periplasmic protein TonB
MKILYLFILFLGIFPLAFSQNKNEEEIFTAVEQQAEFPGGMGACFKLLLKTIPNLTKEVNAGMSPGKIYIQLIIEKDGNISNISILKAISIFSETEDIWLQKLKATLTEKWKPARNQGKAVKSKFMIPFQVCVSE